MHFQSCPPSLSMVIIVLMYICCGRRHAVRRHHALLFLTSRWGDVPSHDIRNSIQVLYVCASKL